MSKSSEALKALDHLKHVFFSNDQVKAESGITEETALEKYEIILRALRKLGKLEDIEKRMGVSLIDVLESAMDSFVGIVDGSEATFFGKSVNLKKMTISGVSISGGFGGNVMHKTFKIAEYGNTWLRTNNYYKKREFSDSLDKTLEKLLTVLSKQNALTHGELAKRMGMKANGLSNLFDRHENYWEYVYLTISDHDKRARYYSLNRKGTEMLSHMKENGK